LWAPILPGLRSWGRLSSGSGLQVPSPSDPFRFAEVDASKYRLGFDLQFPFGVTVREDLSCVPLGEQCRVNYHCAFGSPSGRRGAVLHFLMRRRLDAGPTDSLDRLQREAERLSAEQPG